MNISHVLDALESLVNLVLDDSLALPVSGDDLVGASTLVEDSGHLECEEVNIRLDCGLLHGVLADVVEVALSEELA